MRRRWFLFGFPLAAACTAFAAAAATTIRGKLATSKTNPELQSNDGRRIPLTGDVPTVGVLGDDRLQGVDFEATGTPGEKFQIDPIHTKAMFVHKDGKKLMITYWCDVCYIRTYTPGICWCCQKETDLDLRESISD